MGLEGRKGIDTVEDFMRKYPRLIGVLFLVIGVGLSVWLKHAYDTGESITDKLTIGAPALCLFGLGITIQPRLLILKGEFGTAPPRYKIATILLLVVSLGLGFYVRFALFKDWK
jgi:hypothetical protein